MDEERRLTIMKKHVAAFRAYVETLERKYEEHVWSYPRASTGTVEDTDLGWVTFADEEESLSCWDRDCPLEPVAYAILQADCEHFPGRMPLCLTHTDEVKHTANRKGHLLCNICDQTAYLLRFEPISR